MPTYKPVVQSLVQIQNTAERLAVIAKKLQAEAEAAKLSGFTELTVNNFDQISRAMDYASNYLSAVETAHIKAQRARGDFGGTGSSSVSDTSAPKPKKPGTKRSRSGHPTQSPDTRRSP